MTIQEWPDVSSIGEVKSGERGLIRLHVDLRNSEEESISLFAVRGAKDGPTFHLMAGQHGVELNGCAAAEAFVNEVNPRDLSGLLLTVPVANPVCVRKGQQYPDPPVEPDNNMNRV